MLSQNTSVHRSHMLKPICTINFHSYIRPNTCYEGVKDKMKKNTGWLKIRSNGFNFKMKTGRHLLLHGISKPFPFV